MVLILSFTVCAISVRSLITQQITIGVLDVVYACSIWQPAGFGRCLVGQMNTMILL